MNYTYIINQLLMRTKCILYNSDEGKSKYVKVGYNT